MIDGTAHNRIYIIMINIAQWFHEEKFNLPMSNIILYETIVQYYEDKISLVSSRLGS